MADTMAAKASHSVAAISSVSGQVQLPAIHPTRPVPTREFHSIDDPIAIWKGVENKRPSLRFSVPGAPAAPRRWSPTGSVGLTGSRHVWPGAPFNMGPPGTWILDGVGDGTTFIDANAHMWQFFEHSALPRADGPKRTFRIWSKDGPAHE